MLVLAALILHEVAVDVGIPWPSLFAAIVVLVTWLPVEFVMPLYLRDKRTLRVVNSRPAPPRGA